MHREILLRTPESTASNRESGLYGSGRLGEKARALYLKSPSRCSDQSRLRASDRTMVATNRIACQVSRIDGRRNHPNMKPRERKSKPEKTLSSDREPSANSGLDIETKDLSATGRGRTLFVDIPFYRTTYLSLRLLVIMRILEAGTRLRTSMASLRRATVPLKRRVEFCTVNWALLSFSDSRTYC